MMLIYPIGIPALYAAMLLRNRETLQDEAKMEREVANGWPTVNSMILVDRDMSG